MTLVTPFSDRGESTSPTATHSALLVPLRRPSLTDLPTAPRTPATTAQETN